jgi:hypothetical protein
VVLPTSSNANRLQFYVAGSDGGTDVPTGSQYYTLPSAGAYKLRSGKLTPFNRVLQPATMLVRPPAPSCAACAAQPAAACAAASACRGSASCCLQLWLPGRRRKACLMPLPGV